MGFQIAIDGPAGAGKSTIAKLVAKKLGYTYMDTGAMYRALGLYFEAMPKYPEGHEELMEACSKADVDLKYVDGSQHVYVNGEDVTGNIRTEKAGNAASYASTFPEVREKMVSIQQKLSKTMDVVMDGRDIGTVVLPHAPLKIFMVADVHIRAQRRYIELLDKGQQADLLKIVEDLEARDYQDSHRTVSPLKQAEDAILLDTTNMTIYEVVDRILTLHEECRKRGRH